MPSNTLSVAIPDQLLKRIRTRARKAKQSVEAEVVNLLSNAVAIAPRQRRSRREPASPIGPRRIARIGAIESTPRRCRKLYGAEVLTVARPIVFLDTSFIVALENNRDPYHKKAKKLDRRLLKQRATLLLHSGVLLEIGDGFARLECPTERHRTTSAVSPSKKITWSCRLPAICFKRLSDSTASVRTRNGA